MKEVWDINGKKSFRNPKNQQKMAGTITYGVFYHGYQCFTTTLITIYKPNTVDPRGWEITTVIG
jgi:hypothetical protein